MCVTLDLSYNKRTLFKNEVINEKNESEENAAKNTIASKPFNLRREISFQMCKNPPPEIGVIDISPYATSETGSTAFVEFSSSSAGESWKDRLYGSLPDSVLTVPAVLLAAEREASLPSAGKLVPAATTCGRVEVCQKSCVLSALPNLQYSLCDNSRIYDPAVYSVDKSRHVDFKNYDVCEANKVTTVLCCERLPSDADWSVVKHGLSCVCEDRGMSSCDESSGITPGSKIAQLRKFFDSCANNSSFTSRHEGRSLENARLHHNIPKDKSNVCENTNIGENTPLEPKLVPDENRDDVSYESRLSYSDYIDWEHDDLVTSKHLKYSCDSINDKAKLLNTKTDKAATVSCDKSVPFREECVNRKKCEKSHASEGSLWKNVNIYEKSNSLWVKDSTDDFLLNSSDTEFNLSADTLAASAAELNNLIAASRAELFEKKEPPVLNEKSGLENYFAHAIENSKPNCKLRMNHIWSSVQNDQADLANVVHCDGELSSYEELNDVPNTDVNENTHYEYDGDEIIFDDMDDAVLSDSSSEEEEEDCTGHTNLSTCNSHLPSYALHTIIEESCEESERDSRSATPTNEIPTSKLERYFSWDIVNEAANIVHHADTDESSTVYSDSLSEVSESINGEINNEIEPAHLSSSRLEKYFTSGLLGSENYFYPDDAEFLDDASVSDFEDENKYHKISRSALLNSLKRSSSSASDCVDQASCCDEDAINKQEFENIKEVQQSPDDTVSKDDKNEIGTNLTASLIPSLFDINNINSDTPPDNRNDKINEHEAENSIVSSVHNESHLNISNIDGSDSTTCVLDAESNTSQIESNKLIPDSCVKFENSTDLGNFEQSVECINHAFIFDKVRIDVGAADFSNEMSTTKQYDSLSKQVDGDNDSNVSSQQFIEKNYELPSKSDVGEHFEKEAQVILEKIVNYLADTSQCSPQQKAEMDYSEAWKLLETEIEHLLQSMSPASVENTSCNSSTFGSNNSDYGSDTIESAEYIATDDDDSDSKHKIDSDDHSQPLKFQKIDSVNSFNVSNETIEIWKKFLASLKRDELYSTHADTYDDYIKIRLYIKDQINLLMHAVTAPQKISLVQKPNILDTLHEDKDDILPLFDEHSAQEKSKNHVLLSDNDFEMLEQEDGDVEVKSLMIVDEGISVDSSENLNIDSEMRSVNSTLEDVSNSIEQNILEQFKCVTSESEANSDMKVSEVESVCSTSFTADSENNYVLENSENNVIVHEDINIQSVEPDAKFSKSKQDSEVPFSVYVDIKLGDDVSTVTERKSLDTVKTKSDSNTAAPLVPLRASRKFRSSPNNTLQKNSICSTNSGTKSPSHLRQRNCSAKKSEIQEDDSPVNTKATQRDTGYYSFKSSEDSVVAINDSSFKLPDPDFIDTDDMDMYPSPKCYKMCAPSNVLSRSITNIPGDLADCDLKFSTLQPRSHMSKVSMNPHASSSPSRSIASFLSPVAVFKKLTSKSNSSANSDIPAKYLKKYRRSCSVDSDSMFSAISMPHLNTSTVSDTYTIDCDRESSLTLDETERKYSYSSCNQSALSLGSHSASMTSVYSAAGGRHYGYVSISGDVLFGLNFNQKSQVMEVFVKQCRNLTAVDVKKNRSDPYIKVYLLPDKTKSGKRKTKTKKNTLNPVFNELLRFPVMKHELESRTLWLSVWNSDLFGRNDFLGEVMLPLGYRLLDSPTLRWYPLQERVESLTSPLNYKGELFLALKYVPKDLSLESRFRPAPVISLRGALHVLVKEARNIAAARSSGTCDAFCKSYFLPDKSKNSKQKTPVVKKSHHPKWYYTMIYENLSIEELKERSLELTLWDHDKITSNEFIGGVRLNLGTGLYHGLPVDWMDAFRDEAALWQAMLERPNMWVDGSLPLRSTMQSLPH